MLRHQLDRNPGDPALYERLATFLQQNNFTAEQEQVYKQAAARFKEPTWYDKLARFYLRESNQQAFTALTRQVTDIFSGTDLDPYFARVRELSAPDEGGPALAVQLNLYAAKRFPHDLVFTRNLLDRVPGQAHRKCRRVRGAAAAQLVGVRRPARRVLRVPEPHRASCRRSSPR